MPSRPPDFDPLAPAAHTGGTPLGGLLRWGLFMGALPLCACFSAGAGTAGLRLDFAPPTSLRIATYNVENYGAINRRTPYGFRSDYPKSEAAKQALRATIRELDADILVLQEMGPVEYLLELQRDLRSEGSDYPHTALLRGPDAQRHLAALSRLPLASVHEHTPLRFAYLGEHEDVKRGLLEIRLGTVAGPLAVWAVHLKSRYTDNPADPESAKRRAGEAMRARDFILQRIADTGTAHYLIVGDFNDTKESPPLRYLMQRGALQISQLLPAADSRGEHWTYHNARDDSYARVDHVLISPKLLPAVVGGARIADGPLVRDASDHRPLVVSLDFSVLRPRLESPEQGEARPGAAD